ncbi:MAG TPA: type III pantothenate kinase [Candidatus Limnocylindria bacterium]|jgi:type III pantothenate kinase|nr:type III pantothenate kinase [Candidatus Limnocylindria bacterium]
MILLLDIGNTHTHVGFAQGRRISGVRNLKTGDIRAGRAAELLEPLVKGSRLTGACLCSVVPAATGPIQQALRQGLGFQALQLGPKTLRGVGIDYPRPASIGQDRLANAVAAKHRFGAPVLVVDFGTAVTFDVVDAAGNYLGGVIAPGLAAMTDYLHEKTALLPRIRIREPGSAIGKNTRHAMLAGAVYGYRGLVRQLIHDVKAELGARRLPVVATGGYAKLMARGVREITAVCPELTLEGLRLTWEAHHPPGERG